MFVQSVHNFKLMSSISCFLPVDIIPVEVKSWKTGALRSLHQFMIRADHPYAVRLYAGSVKKIGRKIAFT